MIDLKQLQEDVHKAMSLQSMSGHPSDTISYQSLDKIDDLIEAYKRLQKRYKALLKKQK